MFFTRNAISIINSPVSKTMLRLVCAILDYTFLRGIYTNRIQRRMVEMWRELEILSQKNPLEDITGSKISQAQKRQIPHESTYIRYLEKSKS
jgi:hypothetical protein